MAEIKIYRIYIDRVSERVVDVKIHDGSITQSQHELLVMPLQSAKDYIKTINPNFDVLLIELQMKRDAEEGGEV